MKRSVRELRICDISDITDIITISSFTPRMINSGMRILTFALTPYSHPRCEIVRQIDWLIASNEDKQNIIFVMIELFWLRSSQDKDFFAKLLSI